MTASDFRNHAYCFHDQLFGATSRPRHLRTRHNPHAQSSDKNHDENMSMTDRPRLTDSWCTRGAWSSSAVWLLPL